MKIQDNPQVKKKNHELVDLWFLKSPQKEILKKVTAGIGPILAFRPADGLISAGTWTFSLCEFWKKFL